MERFAKRRLVFSIWAAILVVDLLVGIGCWLVINNGIESYDTRNIAIVTASFFVVTAALGWMLVNAILRARHEAEQTRLLLWGSSDGVHILDRQGTILEASESFCEGLGYTRSELIGKSIFMLDCAKSTEVVTQIINDILKFGQVPNFESAHLARDGSAIPVEVTAKSVTLDGQRVIFASTRNISDRLRAAKELSESEHRFRQLIEKNHSVMLEIEPDSGRIVTANESAATYYGYPREALTNMLITSLNVETPDQVATEMRLAAHELRSYFNFRHRLASGEIRQVEVYSTPIVISGQNHLFSIIHDVSERHQAEQRVKQLVEEQQVILNSEIVGICKLIDRRMVWVNNAYANMFGYSHHELLGQSTDMFYATPKESEDFCKRAYPVIHSGNVFRTQAHYRRKDGSMGWYDVTGTLASAGSTETVWALTDITEIKIAEFSQRLNASVFSNSYDGIVITDAQNNIVAVNPSYVRITGYSPEEAIGKNPRLLSSGTQGGDFYRRMWEEILQNDTWRGEVWNRRKSGEIYAQMLAISTVRNSEGEIQNFIGVFSDISNLKRHEQELARIAHHDALTGLPNRVLLSDRILQAITKARRSNEVVAVVVLDLDGFKAVNDTYGHSAGDRLLIEVSKRLVRTLRAEDTASRIGGDEFVLVLTDVTSQTDCERTLERVLKSIIQPVELDSEHLTKVSASLGYTLFPEDKADADGLLRHADVAMYVAKQSGKNRFTRFDLKLNKRQSANMDVASRLAKGLQRQEFRLFIQPKVNIQTGEIIGGEALIRWLHPIRGLVAPIEFLPLVALNRELSLSFDQWVLGESLRIMSDWLENGLRLPLSINMSAHQFLENNFGAQLGEALQSNPMIRASDFEIEILESAALDDVQHVASLIGQCQQQGVRFALDDFGTGYSTLTYLQKLGVNTLKIDRSFIHEIGKNTGSLSIIQGVIGLAKAFDCDLVAEGVETWEQVDVLTRLGCPVVQGYLIARPMPASDVVDWARNFKQQWKQGKR